MAAGYSIPESDALGMLGDAHSTNYAENREFFLNQNNPTNFERTWNTAYFLYKQINAVTEQTPFDQVMDFSVIQKLGAEPKYASQKNEYDIQFAPATAGTDPGREGRDPHQDGRHPLLPELLGPQQEDHAERRRQGRRGALRSERRLRRRGDRQAGRAVRRGAHRHRGAHRRLDEGPGAEEPGAGAVAEPRERGEGRRSLRKFPSLQPNQFSTAGMGWDRPADPTDPENHAKNRRVEIKVYPAEARRPAK